MIVFLVLAAFGFLLTYIYGSALLDEPAFYWNRPETQEARELKRSLAYLRWRPWYAWHPVKLQDGSWVWCGWVERMRCTTTETRGDWGTYEVEVEHWEYLLS